MKTVEIPQLTDRQLANFHKYIEKSEDLNGCWNWTGSVYPGNYGMFGVSGKSYRAHRISYVLSTGKQIPCGMTIDHLCKNTRCVNPSHFEIVTLQENHKRSNSPSMVNTRKTICMRGHELTGDNVYIRPNGYRQCMVCRRAAYDKYREKNRISSLRYYYNVRKKKK